MQRFLLFMFSESPAGGWNDFVGCFDTPATATDKAISKMLHRSADCFQVIDGQTGEVVLYGNFKKNATRVNQKGTFAV